MIEYRYYVEIAGTADLDLEMLYLPGHPAPFLCSYLAVKIPAQWVEFSLTVLPYTEFPERSSSGSP